MDNELDNEINDSLFSEEEYNDALKVLNASKTSRVKATKKKKAEAKKATNKNDGKKDPVIIGCIIGIILVVIGAVLYFAIPAMSKPSLNMTLNEIRGKYSETSIYTDNLAQYNFAIPAVTYDENNKSNDKYFYAIIDTKIPDYPIAIAIEGTEAKNGKVTEFRAKAQFDQNAFSFYTLYFGSYMQLFFPELSNDVITNMTIEAINSFNDTSYFKCNDIAYRVQYVKANDDFGFLQIEFINPESLDDQNFKTSEYAK